MFRGLGELFVRRRRFVLAGPVSLFVAGIVVGSGVFMHIKDSPGSSATEPARGSKLVDEAS